MPPNLVEQLLHYRILLGGARRNPEASGHSVAIVDELGDLREHAERCRRLARVVEDQRSRQQLRDLAAQLDKQADALEREGLGAAAANESISVRPGSAHSCR